MCGQKAEASALVIKLRHKLQVVILLVVSNHVQ